MELRLGNGPLQGKLQELALAHFGGTGSVTERHVQFVDIPHDAILHGRVSMGKHLGRGYPEDDLAGKRGLYRRKALAVLDAGYVRGAFEPHEARKLGLRKTPCPAMRPQVTKNSSSFRHMC